MNDIPLFVIGVARSGTTLLFRLLNEHPQIRMSYEARLITEGWRHYQQARDLTDRSSFEQLVEKLKSSDRNESLNRWIGDSISKPEAVSTLFETYCQSPSFQKLIEQIYQLPGPTQCWGNKMLRIEASVDILDLWPQARFVVLVRDPRAIYASQKKFFPFRRIKYSTMYYNLHTRWVREQCRDQNSNYLIISYEDFVQDTKHYLEQILRFADVWDETVVNQMLEAHPVHPDNVDKWQQELNSTEIETIESLCFNEMKLAGYNPTKAKRQQTITTVGRAVEVMLENRHRVPLNPAVWYQKNLLQRFWITVSGRK